VFSITTLRDIRLHHGLEMRWSVLRLTAWHMTSIPSVASLSA
jgi:hypothetical protein